MFAVFADVFAKPRILFLFSKVVSFWHSLLEQSAKKCQLFLVLADCFVKVSAMHFPYGLPNFHVPKAKINRMLTFFVRSCETRSTLGQIFQMVGESLEMQVLSKSFFLNKT